MKTSKNSKKELVIKAMKPFEVAVLVLLAIWAIAGTILTAVAVVAGGFATFFIGGAGGWVVGIIGLLLFWVAPWFALNGLAELSREFTTWLRRDPAAEALEAEAAMIINRAFDLNFPSASPGIKAIRGAGRRRL